MIVIAHRDVDRGVFEQRELLGELFMFLLAAHVDAVAVEEQPRRFLRQGVDLGGEAIKVLRHGYRSLFPGRFL